MSMSIQNNTSGDELDESFDPNPNSIPNPNVNVNVQSITGDELDESFDPNINVQSIIDMFKNQSGPSFDSQVDSTKVASLLNDASIDNKAIEKLKTQISGMPRAKLQEMLADIMKNTDFNLNSNLSFDELSQDKSHTADKSPTSKLRDAINRKKNNRKSKFANDIANTNGYHTTTRNHVEKPEPEKSLPIDQKTNTQIPSKNARRNKKRREAAALALALHNQKTIELL